MAGCYFIIIHYNCMLTYDSIINNNSIQCRILEPGKVGKVSTKTYLAKTVPAYTLPLQTVPDPLTDGTCTLKSCGQLRSMMGPELLSTNF